MNDIARRLIQKYGLIEKKSIGWVGVGSKLYHPRRTAIEFLEGLRKRGTSPGVCDRREVEDLVWFVETLLV